MLYKLPFSAQDRIEDSGSVALAPGKRSREERKPCDNRGTFQGLSSASTDLPAEMDGGKDVYVMVLPQYMRQRPPLT